MIGDFHRNPKKSVLGTSFEAALACAGAYTCSGVSATEIDDVDKRVEKLCRIGSAVTCETETRSWSGYRTHPLLDDEDSLLTKNSCASTVFDDGTSRDSLARGESEISQVISLPVSELRTQILVHTIQREERKDAEKRTQKTKPSWVPQLKKKWKDIVRKCNQTEGSYNKQLSITLSKMTLGMKSKGKIPGIKKTNKKIGKFMMPNHFHDNLPGFEVSRIGTNHVSIIDRSLLSPGEVTPADTSTINKEKPPTLRNHANHNALKPEEPTSIPIKIFGESFLLDHLMIPSIDGGMAKHNPSISPKPANFVDVLDEIATQSTLSSCSGEFFIPEDPKNDLVVEETSGNGDCSDFEIMYSIRAPYKMSRHTEDPGY